jgi:hypothetical protein
MEDILMVFLIIGVVNALAAIFTGLFDGLPVLDTIFSVAFYVLLWPVQVASAMFGVLEAMMEKTHS